MQSLEVSGAVRPMYGSLGVKLLTTTYSPPAKHNPEQTQSEITIKRNMTLPEI